MSDAGPPLEPIGTERTASAVERFRADLASLRRDATGRLLLAVSGGADSLALLILARAVAEGSIHAATVDHGLREEAAQEAEHVAQICRALGVPHAILRGTMPTRVAGSANLSGRARELRYRLLEEHRLATGSALVATAHHADDQLETLVMRLNRGAAVGGLSGIRTRVAKVIRPLLSWRRAELAAVVDEAGLRAVSDPFNVDDRFDRARVRKAIGRADWLDAVRWTRSALALAEAEDALAWTARRLGAELIREDGRGVTLTLANEPAEIRRRLVSDCLARMSTGARARGDELQRLLAMIEAAGVERSTKATLADVLIAAERAGDGLIIRFESAPARRSGN